ncbi:hypothetical protein CR513_06393, partial [Mucuna pruriens]
MKWKKIVKLCSIKSYNKKKSPKLNPIFFIDDAFLFAKDKSSQLIILRVFGETRLINSLQSHLSVPLLILIDTLVFIQDWLLGINKLLINKPGRLAPANSVLTVIPSYYMHIFWLPQATCDMIAKIVLGWNKITWSKKLGDLGVYSSNSGIIGGCYNL